MVAFKSSKCLSWLAAYYMSTLTDLLVFRDYSTYISL